MTGTGKALKLIRDNEIRSPRGFAKLMWPDSEGWQQMHKCGPYGASRGIMMAMAAGGFLGKLRQQGLIANTMIILTDKGRERLLQEVSNE